MSIEREHLPRHGKRWVRPVAVLAVLGSLVGGGLWADQAKNQGKFVGTIASAFATAGAPRPTDIPVPTETPQPTETPLPYSTNEASYRVVINYSGRGDSIHMYTNIWPKIQIEGKNTTVFIANNVYCPQNQKDATFSNPGIPDSDWNEAGCNNVFNPKLEIITQNTITVVGK